MYKKYLNHCWSCKHQITSNTAIRCRICGWYICPLCGACSKDCPHYDSEGYDQYDFNRNKIHRNGTKYDNEGFDADGMGKDGYDRFGFDINGFDRDGYNRLGFDINGFDRDGYNESGYDINGYDRNGYNKQGFNKNGMHKSGNLYDEKGLNVDGVDVLYLQCKNYVVGTKVIHDGLFGTIIGYDPQKGNPLIKIKYENDLVKMFDLKTLIKNESISLHKDKGD